MADSLLPNENDSSDQPLADAGDDGSSEEVLSAHESPELANAFSFDNQLKVALEEAFPVLLDRLRYVGFADWHRRAGLDMDLAQSAMLEVFRRCNKSHFI